ncbi:hypothetical protein [Lysobacter sp. FW306-1B-D06B]|uniref:tetratricopeptide repeat protein n=1 Tax=Lysobacter sp. FW306-1B-D06B TaxID=3140250 RepID=UPI0031404CD5
MHVKRSLLLAAGLALSNHAGMATAAADTPPPSVGATDPQQQWFRQQLAAAHALARANQAASAQQAFARVFDDPQFSSLEPAQQRAALSKAGWMAIQQDQGAQALALYRRALAQDDSDPDDWYRVAMLEMDMGRPDAGAVAFIEVVERWPDALPNVREQYILQLVYRSTTGSPERLALLQALLNANWRSRLGGEAEAWYELAVEAMDRGDTETARAVIRRIEAAKPLIRLRSDKRFDGAMAADSWSTNAERAAQRQVDALMQQMGATPDDLRVRSYLASALLTAGQNEQAIEMTTRTLDEIAAAPSGSPAFEDLDPQVWLMNYRAIALRRLGRTDEALAELQRAAQLTEGGEQNISQALNLGVFYCSLERPVDALRAIDVLGDDISGYGRMVEQSVRHCAALQKQDRRGARRALAYLRDHREDGELLYVSALLREGDVDQAAQRVRALLASPEDRGAVLGWMQDFLRPAPLPGDVAARAARDTLLARADVREALAPVGRIAHYELYLDDSMD